MADTPAHQRRAGRGCARRSTRWRNTPRISRSRTRTRRARSQPQSAGPADQHPGQRQRQAAGRGRFRGRADPRGRRQDRQRGAVRLRAELFGRVPRAQHPAGPDPSGGDDRVPAPAVPVRAPDRGRRGAQRRLPAALHRPDRFRRPLSPEGDARRSRPPSRSRRPAQVNPSGADRGRASAAKGGARRSASSRRDSRARAHRRRASPTKARMRRALGVREPHDDRGGVRAAIAAARLQPQAPRRGRACRPRSGLLAADQLDIDLGQDLGVEQRAVLGAPRIVDAIARAQRVEVVGAPGCLRRASDRVSTRRSDRAAARRCGRIPH